MDQKFAADPRYVPLQIQTVFEGFETNTFERGQRELQKLGITAIYGHDPGRDGRRSNILQSYHTGGTPWTILIDHTGKVLISQFASRLDADRLAEAVQAALDAAPKAGPQGEQAPDKKPDLREEDF